MHVYFYGCIIIVAFYTFWHGFMMCLNQLVNFTVYFLNNIYIFNLSNKFFHQMKVQNDHLTMSKCACMEHHL